MKKSNSCGQGSRNHDETETMTKGKGYFGSAGINGDNIRMDVIELEKLGEFQDSVGCVVRVATTIHGRDECWS